MFLHRECACDDDCDAGDDVHDDGDDDAEKTVMAVQDTSDMDEISVHKNGDCRVSTNSYTMDIDNIAG